MALFLRIVNDGKFTGLFKHGNLGFRIGDVVFFHFLFPVCRIVDGTKQDAAVLGRVGQSCKIDTAALAVFIHYKTAVLTVHVENLVMFSLGIDAALALTEINICRHILQDEMFRIQGVIFVGTHGKAQFPVYAQYIAQLEETALILTGGGFSYTDEAAALIHKTAQGTD